MRTHRGSLLVVLCSLLILTLAPAPAAAEESSGVEWGFFAGGFGGMMMLPENQVGGSFGPAVDVWAGPLAWPVIPWAGGGLGFHTGDQAGTFAPFAEGGLAVKLLGYAELGAGYSFDVDQGTELLPAWHIVVRKTIAGAPVGTFGGKQGFAGLGVYFRHHIPTSEDAGSFTSAGVQLGFTLQ